MGLEEHEAQIMEERQAQYGSGVLGHANLGLEWTGILQNHYGIELPHPIPPHVVCLMMAANKINRAALQTERRDDDYADARNYLRIAYDAKGHCQSPDANPS